VTGSGLARVHKRPTFGQLAVHMQATEVLVACLC
jgi:hypothetical protein